MSKSEEVIINKNTQEEVLLKRLMYQLATDRLELADNKTEHNVPLDLSPATLNRIKWEYILVHAEQLNEEWDYVIAGFDDPDFDWASAAPPKASDLPSVNKKYDELVNEIFDRFEEHQIQEIFEAAIDSSFGDLALLKHLMAEMFKFREGTANQCISSIEDMGVDDCSCFAKKLYAILEG